jgi:hypothetical protein
VIIEISISMNCPHFMSNTITLLVLIEIQKQMNREFSDKMSGCVKVVCGRTS